MPWGQTCNSYQLCRAQRSKVTDWRWSMTDLWNWIIVNRLKSSSADTALLCTFGSTVRPDPTALLFCSFFFFFGIPIVSFHILEKCNCFRFWKSNFKMALIKKEGYFWPTFHIFLVTSEKTQKFLHQISHLHTYTYIALPILQKLRIYHVWFLFGATPGADSYSRHFGAINK